MADINLDNEFLELFYGITNSKVPAKIDLLALKKQAISISEIVQKSNHNESKHSAIPTQADIVVENNGPAILVIDDLGVITYQLKVLLSQFNYDIDCSQEIYDAVNKYKKRKYEYVVMDLFIPTEREGFILLTELKKMIASFGVKTIVGVITASPRKEIEQQCKLRGADFFLEKNSAWQNTLFTIMKKYIDEGKDDEEEDY